MNINKHHPMDCFNCRILASYESVQKEYETSAPASQLQAIKLEILEKLIKDNKCPGGHDLNHKPD
jgi:hypothetical protein